MDGPVQQVGNRTACQQSSSYLHPSKHTGNGKIFLSWPWYCPWASMSKEYPKHEIDSALSYQITGSIFAWFSRVMEATAHRRNVSEADILGECHNWNTWYQWEIEVYLPIGINHSRRFDCRKSKPCNHFIIHRVGTATCRLDQDNQGDVSWSWWSGELDTQAKQHVCVKASEWNGINRYM